MTCSLELAGYVRMIWPLREREKRKKCGPTQLKINDPLSWPFWSGEKKKIPKP